MQNPERIKKYINYPILKNYPNKIILEGIFQKWYIKTITNDYL